MFLVPFLVLLSALFAGLPELLLRPARNHDDAAWADLMAMAVPVMACLAVLAPADGLQFCWRFAIQGAGDTRWPLVVLVTLALLLMALPVWLLRPWFGGGVHGLVWCYGILCTYTWIIAGVMAWRFYRGPWPTMTVRG
jgi:MATE family multidrug resistance protein